MQAGRCFPRSNHAACVTKPAVLDKPDLIHRYLGDVANADVKNALKNLYGMG